MVIVVHPFVEKQLSSYSFQVKKLTCQTTYRGIGAKQMAAAKRAADEATAAATRRYKDPREALTTAELKSTLEQQTGQSMSKLIHK